MGFTYFSWIFDVLHSQTKEKPQGIVKFPCVQFAEKTTEHFCWQCLKHCVENVPPERFQDKTVHMIKQGESGLVRFPLPLLLRAPEEWRKEFRHLRMAARDSVP